MKTSLPTTELGRTGMRLTRAGFGAWAIGGGDWAFAWGNQDDAASVAAAIVVVAAELLTLAYLRHRFFQTSFARSFVAVAVGGAVIAALSAGLGVAAGG